MPHWKKMFPSNYIRACDLEGRGDVTVTIRELHLDEVHNPDTNGKETKPVLYFTKGTKGLILNVTNAETIAQLYGDDTDGWAGQRIALFLQPGVKAFGKVWDAVRIRTRIPADPNGSQPDSISLLTDEADRLTHGTDREAGDQAGGESQDMALLYGAEPDLVVREEVIS